MDKKPKDFSFPCIPLSILILWVTVVPVFGQLFLMLIPVFAFIGFVSTFFYHTKKKKFLLSHPLTFEYSKFNLSVLGTRVQKEASKVTFFAELLRMNEKNAISINPNTKGTYIIKKSKRDLQNLTHEQKIIFDSLTSIQKSFTAWTKEVNPLKMKPINVDASYKRAIKFSFVMFIKLIFASIFVPVFSIVLFAFLLCCKLFKLPTEEQIEKNHIEEKEYKNKIILINIFTILAIIIYISSMFLLISSGSVYLAIGLLILIVAIVSFIWVIFPERLNDNTDRSFLIRVRKSLSEYSELEKENKVEYFLMYGDEAAWALAVNLAHPKTITNIEKFLKDVEIKQ